MQINSEYIQFIIQHQQRLAYSINNRRCQKMLPCADLLCFFKSGYINKTNHQSIKSYFRSPIRENTQQIPVHHLPSVPRYFCKQGFQYGFSIIKSDDYI